MTPNIVESYIVRVYRGDEQGGDGIIGVVEVVNSGEVKKFGCRDELYEIFRPNKRAERRQRKKRGIGPE